MCRASDNCKLQERVNAIDHRVTRLEENMTSGFQTVTSAVNNLASDFGERMNMMSTKLVDEKVAWGQWARTNLSKVVLWACGLIAFACGMNKMPEIINAIKGLSAN